MARPAVTRLSSVGSGRGLKPGAGAVQRHSEVTHVSQAGRRRKPGSRMSIGYRDGGDLGLVKPAIPSRTA